MKTATQVLEDHMAYEAAKRVAEDIDFEVMSTLLVESGWTKIELETLGSNKKAIDMREWAEAEGITAHGVYQRGRTWLFKCYEDAILFKLTWS